MLRGSSIALRRVAPTLAPLSWLALRSGLDALLRPGAWRGELQRQLHTLYPTATIIPLTSGRAALTEAIRIAMLSTGRPRVVIPAYTSFSVAAAAVAAGAAVDVCDVNPETLQLDREALNGCVSDSTAAVVLGNLFGFPDSTADLTWLDESGAMIIDDAAQALGATEHGRRAGGRGALGVLSFGRGKCVTLGEGGALLINDPSLVGRAFGEPMPEGGRGFAAWLAGCAITACASGSVFGILSRLPGVGVGESHYSPRVRVRAAPSSVDGMAVDLAAAVARHLEVRQQAARRWQRMFVDASDFTVPPIMDGVSPAYLRMPVFTTSLRDREELVGRLSLGRFRFVRSYPFGLSHLQALQGGAHGKRAAPGADWIADHVIALPCHRWITDGDLHRAAVAFGVKNPDE